MQADTGTVSDQHTISCLSLLYMACESRTALRVRMLSSSMSFILIAHFVFLSLPVFAHSMFASTCDVSRVSFPDLNTFCFPG